MPYHTCSRLPELIFAPSLSWDFFKSPTKACLRVDVSLAPLELPPLDLTSSIPTSISPEEKSQQPAYLTPSLHPIGISAAATSSTPLSVASRLYCAAAFRVSSTSTLMPRFPIARLVAGLSGRISGPNPNINKSTTPHNKSHQQYALHIPPNHSKQRRRKRRRKDKTYQA